jgi:hypothetical protein
MIERNLTNKPIRGLIRSYQLDWNANDSVWTNNGTATNVTYVDSDIWYNKRCGSFWATSNITFSSISNVTWFWIWIYPTANTKTLATFVTSTSLITINSSNQIVTTGLTNVTTYVDNQVWTTIILNKWNYVFLKFDAKTLTNYSLWNSSYLGLIDEVDIYNVALTEKEIQDLYWHWMRQLNWWSYFWANGLLRGCVWFFDVADWSNTLSELLNWTVVTRTAW